MFSRKSKSFYEKEENDGHVNLAIAELPHPVLIGIFLMKM